MSYKIYFTILLSLSLALVYSQDVVLSSDIYPEMRYLGTSGKVYYNEYQQVRGSGFVSDDWTSGDIYFVDGKVVKNVNLKLDVYVHQVILYQDLLKRMLIIDKKTIDKIVLHGNGIDRKFLRIEFTKAKAYSSDGVFVEVLTEGKVSFHKLFYKERIFLSTPVRPYIYEFIDGKDYQINYNSENLNVSLNKHSLIKIFPELKPQIKQYVRSSHLKLKKEEDFAKVVLYINSIKN